MHERAQKRGGQCRILSLELAGSDVTAAASADPGAEYDRQWALTVMERSLQALEREFAGAARSGPFEVLAAYFRTGEPPSCTACERAVALPA